MKRLLPHAATFAALIVGQVVAVAQDPGFLPAQQQSQSRQRQQMPAAAPAEPATREKDDVAASAARITSMSQLDDSTPLRIKDQIVLRIVEDKGEPRSLMVQDSGDIFAPYIGLVKAAGRTPRQLAGYMKTELEKQYFQQATVIVALERKYMPAGRGGRPGDGYVVEDMGYITIYGQVLRQGKYEFAPEDQLTASQAILRAGGFAPFAKDKAVKIIRKVPNKGNVTIVVNLRDVMTKGRLEKDIAIMPNDTIIVEEKLINF
ncbi:MAG TPA: polysaccharide biosynthesis/export family protein [Candidatus Saccharimonadia bacterium]|nr:polysaccharide biosynthesis/export family protein [Candidatus Saccharimonadia bacterium]